MLSISSAHAETTLRDAFNLARKNSETLPLQKQSIIQAEENLSQIKGAIFPTIDLNANYQRLDTHRLSNTDPDQTNAYLSLTQPLFQGLREFAALDQFNAQLRAQSEFALSAELSLYGDVAQAFFNVLSTRKEIEDLNELIAISEKRTQEVKKRVQVGRSRLGEQLSAETQLLTSRALLETAKDSEQRAAKQYVFLTRVNPDTLLDNTVLPQTLPPLDSLKSRARERPNLKAQRELLFSTEKQVSYVRGGHFPTLDLKGNYHLKREGSLQNSKWDAGLYFTLPIFQGGVISSQVSEALSVQKQQELTLKQLEASTDRDLDQNYESLKALLNQLKQYETALQVADRNYRLQERDYSLGLVNQIDVLQALDSLTTNKRAYNRTLYQAKAAHHQLKALIGELP